MTAQQFYEKWRIEHADDSRGDWPIRMLQDYMDRERLRSQGAGRIELKFQVDRMTEKEWSADTWIKIPSGAWEILGWVPCESQQEAQEEVEKSKALYESVRSVEGAGQWEAALRKILELKHALDADRCTNPSDHAACLDNFATEVEEIVAGLASPPESKP